MCRRMPRRTSYLRGLLRITLVIVLIFVVGRRGWGLMFYLMSWAGNHVLRQLEVEVFEQLERLSLGYPHGA